MKRPVFLTIWLVLMSLGALNGLYKYIFGNVGLDLPSGYSLPEWVYNTLIVALVIYLVAIILLWMWKKIGFYVLIVDSFIISLVLGLTFTKSPIGLFIVLIFLFIPIGVLYLAMRSVWKNFK